VVGLPSERSGEDVVAAIVLKKGASLDEKAIEAFARETLTAYKVPRRYVIVEELPKSLIGKVLRRKVRDGVLERDAS
jgi:long-chain acyl-CoA synthetase